MLFGNRGPRGLRSEGMPTVTCSADVHDNVSSPSANADETVEATLWLRWFRQLARLLQLSAVLVMTSSAVCAQTENAEEGNAKSVRAEPVELRWVRLEGAEQCPPKAGFEAALQKRLGRASFSSRGTRILTVTLSNEKGPFRAVLSLKARASEELESKQELFSYSSQCDEVFSATVLSVALLLNPDEMDAAADPKPLEDTDFFDPPSDDVGVAVPSPAPPGQSSAEDPEPNAGFDIPVAPRAWARSHGAVSAGFAMGIEQLPRPAPGFSARTEWPVAENWLLWLAADWLLSGPAPEVGTGVTITQSAGWAGGSWLPYESSVIEFHLLGGLGFRQLTATLTASDPRHHFALQLGAGLLVKLTEQFGVDCRAVAVVPLRSELFGQSWTQPAVGGQLQIGVTVGIPNPPAPN